VTEKDNASCNLKSKFFYSLNKNIPVRYVFRSNIPPLNTYDFKSVYGRKYGNSLNCNFSNLVEELEYVAFPRI